MRFSFLRAIAASVACAAWLASGAAPSAAQSGETVQEEKPAKPAKKRKRAAAEAGSLHERINRGMVSVVLLDEDEDPVNDIARALNEEGRMRIVSILGESAVANVRDLLYLRGVDAGILNADILPYLRITGELPAAQRRVRYVTKMFDKTVFLVVGPSIAGLQDLAGKKLATTGEAHDSGVSARTIITLSNLPAELVEMKMSRAVEGLLTGEVSGLIAVERDATALLRYIPEGSGLRIAPLPVTTALSEVYATRQVDALEAPSLLPPEGVQTLTVPAVLAVFDWKQGGTRYPAVADFVESLIAHTVDAASFEKGRAWREMTPDAEIAGWQRFAAAEESILATADQRKALPRPADDSAVGIATTQAPALPAGTATASAIAPAPVETVATATLAATAAVAQPGILRLVASRRAPLIDDTQQGGGIVTEILTSGLAADGAAGVQLTWSSDRNTELNGLVEGRSYDAGLAWATSDCDNISELSEQSAVLCDQFLFSQPILQVLTVLFSRSDAGFAFADDSEIAGKSICLPEGADEAELNRQGRGWLKQQTVTLVRAPSLQDCFKMVSARDADIVMASEIEGRTALAASGLASEIEMAERPLATESLAAVVAKTHPSAEAVVARINDALVKVKANGGYYSLVDKHLVALWGKAPATP